MVVVMIYGRFQRWGQLFLHCLHSCLFDLFALAPPVLQVELMDTIFNYYAFNTIYPSLNGKNSCKT